MLLALLSGLLALAGATPAYQGSVDALYRQSDTDNDGVLSESEFVEAARKLGPDLERAIRRHVGRGRNIWAMGQDADTAGDNDNTVSKQELIDYVSSTDAALRDAFITAATNRPTADEITIVAPPDGVKNSRAVVEVEIMAAGSITDIFPGVRRTIKAYFSNLMGVPESQITLTFLPGSVKVKATAFVADAAAANEAREAAAAALATPALASAAIGLQVEETPVVRTKERKNTDKEKIAAALGSGVAWLFLVIVVSVVAGVVAKKKLARENGQPVGCLKTGCCSYYAVHVWYEHPRTSHPNLTPLSPHPTAPHPTPHRCSPHPGRSPRSSPSSGSASAAGCSSCACSR